MSTACRNAAAFQERVVGRVFVEIAQGRVVETGAIKNTGANPGQHRDQTDMNQFRRLFTDDVDSEQAHVFRTKDQF